MTTNTNPATAPSNSRAPSHSVYHVRDARPDSGGKGFWTRVGAAWPHADGKGFNLQVDLVPLDGRLTLRVFTEEKA